MTHVSDNKSPYLTFVEQGSDPDAAAAGEKKLFIDSADHLMKTIDESAVVEEVGGGGGRTLIQELTPTGTGTASFTSIPGTYKKLIIEFMIRSTVSSNMDALTVEINGDSTSANYRYIMQFSYGVGTSNAVGADGSTMDDIISGNNAPSGSFTMGKMEILQYANTNFNKQIRLDLSHRRDASSIHEMIINSSVEWENTAAIDQLDIILSAGDFAANSVLRLYGEN
jgi:hypothetical protein